jgi:hypothetical protein
MPGNPARRPKAVVIRTRRKPKGQEKLFAAVAIVTYLAQPSNTFSGNAASHGASFAAASAASPEHTYPPYSRHFYRERMYTPHHYWPKPYTPQGYTAAGTGGQGAPVQQNMPSHGSPSDIAGTATQPSTGGSSSSSAGTATQPSTGGSSSSSAGTATQPSTGGSSPSTANTTTQASSTGSSGASASSLSDVPGVPQAFAACVAFRESTNLENPAADGNAYGIIPASGYNVSGTSLAYQKQVFAELYKQYGTEPWASDGCAD